MAGITQYDIMREVNLRVADIIYYLIQDTGRILNSESIDLDIIKKYKNHLYVFIENILFTPDEDGNFTIQSSDVNSLVDLHAGLENLRSFLRNNYNNIVTNKLENLIMVDRTIDDYMKNITFFERRFRAVLNWIHIPIRKIRHLIEPMLDIEGSDQDTDSVDTEEYLDNLFLSDTESEEHEEDIHEPDLQINYLTDHTLTDAIIEESIIGKHNE